MGGKRLTKILESPTDAIERELWIAARPETVFAYLIDPIKLVEWMGRSATLDPRAGGLFRLDLNGAMVARGEYVEVVENKRVAFTWGWEASDEVVQPGDSLVEITLRRDGDGTSLHLRHSGLPGDEARSHGEGWDQFLPQLVALLAGKELVRV
jgi:uncharacterized protein YndB with AHSA1/START domain